MNVERRAARAHEKIPDLGWFLTRGREFGARPGTTRSQGLARALFEALSQGPDGAARRASLPHRILIDPFLLAEHDRDQNVYLGGFFTRVLTRAVPDLIFQPLDAAEVAAALRWAR